MRSELIPGITPVLLDMKIREWLEQQPATPFEELTMLIGIRGNDGPVYRIIMASANEYPQVCAFLANNLRMIDELEDITSQLEGCDALFKMRPVRQPLLEP